MSYLTNISNTPETEMIVDYEINKANYNDIEEDADHHILSSNFDRICNIVEKSIPEEYQYILCNEKDLSICPSCYVPVFATEKYVICSNKCFTFPTPNCLLNNFISLDNLMDLLKNKLKEHPNCLHSFEVYEHEGNVMVLCLNCGH